MFLVAWLSGNQYGISACINKQYMKKSSYILWLGMCFDEATMISSPAVSPAANRWQSGLIRALQESGCDVQILGHRPEPVWPRGDFYVRGGTENVPLIGGGPQTHQHLTGYLNIYRLREFMLRRQYLNLSRRIFQSGKRPHFVLCYNVYPHSDAVGREAMRHGIPWIPVVADAPGDPLAYHRLEEKLRVAAGCVFLSWHSYEKWTGGPKIHLDGGVSAMPKEEIDLPKSGGPKIIFYSGVLNQFGGVELLLDAFEIIKNQDAHLWVCGKGYNKKLQQSIKKDRRITFYGCVDELALRQLSQQAWVMVNPRPNSVVDSQHNFPSKLLEYLSYGKPVISTCTPGIAPEYSHVIDIPEDETPAGLAGVIQRVLQWSEVQRRERAVAIREFLKTRKTWIVQARRLTEWLEDQMLR